MDTYQNTISFYFYNFQAKCLRLEYIKEKNKGGGLVAVCKDDLRPYNS